jgi:hypothetical protein
VLECGAGVLLAPLFGKGETVGIKQQVEFDIDLDADIGLATFGSPDSVVGLECPWFDPSTQQCRLVVSFECHNGRHKVARLGYQVTGKSAVWRPLPLLPAYVLIAMEYARAAMFECQECGGDV